MSNISVINILNDVAIVKQGAAVGTIDLSRFDTEGFFSAQIELAGTGAVDVVASLSNNGTDFITPSGMANLFSTFNATSGEGSDGKSIVSFDPLLARYLRITATEDNTNPITALTIWVALQ
jgi:hypothetical protein